MIDRFTLNRSVDGFRRIYRELADDRPPRPAPAVTPAQLRLRIPAPRRTSAPLVTGGTPA